MLFNHFCPLSPCPLDDVCTVSALHVYPCELPLHLVTFHNQVQEEVNKPNVIFSEILCASKNVNHLNSIEYNAYHFVVMFISH